MSTKDFYRAFEEKLRGSRELIKERVSVYLPFVLPLKELCPDVTSLDIGCGRGEWLELLKEKNILSQGIDLDEGMLEACHTLGLNVQKGEGIAYLKAQKDESMSLITAFHVVEHISFEDLQCLVEEALRVLVPGGLLIMETPNPENIKVGTENFYLDPTHLKPIPSSLLSFLPEYYGYERTKVLRLQESKNLLDNHNLSLQEVLAGVSPDYAVIAQKEARKEIVSQFDEAFSKDFGLSLEALSDRFENRIRYLELKVEEAEQTALQTEVKASQTEDKTVQVEHIVSNTEHKLLQIATKANNAEQKAIKAETKAAKAERKANEMEHKIQTTLHHYQIITTSNSWKMTKPLRFVGKKVRWFTTGVKHWVTLSPTSRPRRVVKKSLISSKEYINKYPKFKMKLIKIQNYFYKFKNILLNIIFKQSHGGVELTLQAQNIFNKLKPLCNSIEKKQQNSDNNKMAIITPIPPDQSGIAYYVDELLPSLSKIYDIEIITDNVESYQNYTVHNVDFFKKNSTRYNHIIYQLGNSPYHWYMFDLIQQYPGIVVLHDFYLGNVIHWIQENKNSSSNIWDNLLLDTYGYSSLYMKAKYGIHWAIHNYPVNAHIFQNAKGIIVHSEYAKNLSEYWYKGKYSNKIHYLPQVHQIQTKHKLNNKEFLVCSFGHITEQKLIHKIISSWIASKLHEYPNTRLVFVGSFGLDEYSKNIKELIKSLPNVEVTGFIDDSEYKNYLLQTNIAIQLRTDSRGETSRATLDCMSYGIPTIVNAHGALAELDKNAVFMIQNEFSDDELVTALDTLSNDENLYRHISTNAIKIISQKHQPKIISKIMQNIIKEIYQKKTLPTLLETCEKYQEQHTTITDSQLKTLAKEYEETLRSSQISTLYIDISVIVINDLKTGIQRVVRAILISLFELHINNFKIVPVYLTDKNGYWHYRTAHNYTKSIIPNIIYRTDSIVEPLKHDIFLGLDFYAGGICQAKQSNLFDTWKQRGVNINFIIYDILPISFPKFFPSSSCETHIEWLKTIYEISDNLICISETVANQVEEYLSNTKMKNENIPAMKFFHLGADIKSSIPTKGLPLKANSILKKLASNHSFLMLGTIEPRKGHMQTLLAFETLWENAIDVNLVIVGKEGWLTETLIKRISEHTELNKHLYWINNASDEYVEKIYTASTCLIAASEDEGFGLPLIEAAQKKMPILARDIPVFQEVAGEYAYYFENSKNASVIVDAIKNWLQLYKENKHPKSDTMPWLTWEESTKQLLKCLNIKNNSKGKK